MSVRADRLSLPRWSVAWLLVLPGVAVLAFGFLYPVVATFVAPPSAGEVNLAGTFVTMVSDSYVLEVAARTVRIAALVTASCLVLGFPVAYLISRASPRWRGLLLAITVFPLLLSTVVRTYSWLVILGRNGLLSKAMVGLGLADEPQQLLFTDFAVIVGLVQLFLPIVILTAYSSLSHVDDRLLEAARGLGASSGRVFRRIVLPLALPGALIGATLAFAGSVTAFTTPLLLGGTGVRTLATLLYTYASVTLDWGAASAIALLMTLIVLVVGAATTYARGKGRVA
jgi:putative spermidine/putrescine transport system permease protein